MKHDLQKIQNDLMAGGITLILLALCVLACVVAATGGKP